MAVDIILSQPRPRLETVTERGPNGSRTLVMSLTTPTGDDAAPRVSLRREPSDPEPEPATIAALVAAGETDEGLDRLRLGTLYLLSPPGKTGTTPDKEWQPTPRNEVFWNLNHAVATDISAIPPLRLNLGAAGLLAGGAAQGILGQALADIASLDAQAAAFLSRGRIEGRRGAATMLQINPHTLRARMRKLGIDAERFRD
jgi:hypothetical protein